MTLANAGVLTTDERGWTRIETDLSVARPICVHLGASVVNTLPSSGGTLEAKQKCPHLWRSGTVAATVYGIAISRHSCSLVETGIRAAAISAEWIIKADL